MTTTVEVHYNTSRVGTLVIGDGIRPTVEFSYAANWIADGFAIDPDLPLSRAPFSRSGSLFGALRDSAPDEWGRGLLARSHQGRSLSEADCLLGVSDLTRQGALRFRTADEWLTTHSPVPVLTDLEALRRAATEYEEGRGAPARDLATAGAGTGGARPKVVIEEGGHLWIAKFGRQDDLIETEVAEHIIALLAHRADVVMASTRLESDLTEPVLMSRRFDRAGERRLGYLSALSLLESQVDPHRSGLYDYLELADVLPAWCAHPTRDLHELWRRIAFGCLVGNTDDHMRNHAFIRRADGWSLSPAFDITIDIRRWNQSVTSVDGETGDQKLQALIGASDYFRLTPAQARTILDEVLVAVDSLDDVMSPFGATPTTEAIRDVVRARRPTV